MLYTVIHALISAGRTDGLSGKIDVLYAAGNLTDEQYTELTAMLPQEG